MKLHPIRTALLVAAFTFAGCAPEPEPAPAAPAVAPATSPAAAPEVAPPVAAEAAAPVTPGVAAAPVAPAPQGSPVYLDVRTPEEYAAGHVQGALFIPYDQIAARIAELDRYRDTDVVVYCRTGRRSGIAIETLKANGFTRLTNGGGLDDVVRERGLPVTTGN